MQINKELQRFMPSNGTEGEIFTGQFCSHCIHEEYLVKGYGKQCEILDNSMVNDRPCFNKDLKFDGWEWFSNYDYNNLELKCNQHKYWDWGNDRNGFNEPPEIIPDDPNQLILFSFDEDLDELLKEKELVAYEK